MSRRSKRRGGAGGAGWLGKLALGLILIAVLGAAVLYGLVRTYLHSEGFRTFLAAKASEVSGVDGKFAPFRWDGLAVESPAFEGSGPGWVKHVRIDGLHTEVGLSGLGRGVWEIQGSRAKRLEVSVDGRRRAMPASGSESPDLPPPAKPGKQWLPKEVEVQGLELGQVFVHALLDPGEASVLGMTVRMEQAGAKKAYRMELADGVIRLPYPGMPEIRLDRAKLRYQNHELFLNSATATAWKDGRIEASGEWSGITGRHALQGRVSGVKCEDVFSETWAKRFIGEVDSEFTIDNSSGETVARGGLQVLNGTLTALPMLDALAAYADTRRFRVLSLSDARTDWRWRKGELFFSNLVLASEGLMRVEGNLFIRGKELDGNFRLGLAAGTLATIPGAETDVFAMGERGLMWTSLRITGTLDDPKEDLTDRLVAAAGLRMFDIIPETGEKVIKFSRALLGESPSKTIDKGIELIEEGAVIIDSAGGLIDGLLGGSRRPEPKTEKRK